MWPRRARTMRIRLSGEVATPTSCCARTTRPWAPSCAKTARARSTSSGFASQLVFTTWCLNNFGLERRDQAELAYATASAHNRMMMDFCSIDRRFLATAYVPLVDIDRAIATAREAIAMGAKALLIPSRPHRSLRQPYRA